MATIPSGCRYFLSLFLFLSATRSCNSFVPQDVSHRPITPTTSTRLLAAQVANSDVLAKGRLVEFTTATGQGASKTTTLGAILGPDGKRNLKILTSSGRTSSVPPKNIRHVVPNGRSISTEAQIEEHERAAAAALESDAETNGQNVAEVWEMMLEDDADTVELTTLADLIVGDDTSISCYATGAVLTNGVESFCFKEVNAKGKLSEENVCTLYEPRLVEVVETMRSKARQEAEEEAKWVELNQRIDEACNIDSMFTLQDESEEVQATFQSLERLGCLANLSPAEAEREEKAALGDDAEAIDAAKEFLKKLGRRSTPEAARALLVGTGIWNIHTNLDLIRLRIPTTFAPGLEDLAIELATNPPPDVDEASRVDLTHLSAYAIDEATTREIDDALSVEILSDAEEAGGPMHTHLRLWVHIADPTRYVELGSPLDKEARRRASSLYLPTGTVPMFPMTLASGPLSLSPGEVSCALSVGLMLDSDGGIDESTPPVITPSLVRTTRLTYDQVDSLLEPFAMIENSNDQEDSDKEDTIDDIETTTEALRRLEWASEKRLQWRKDGGSLESIGPYELPDVSVKAWPSPDERDGWGVEIVAKERYAASRIVAELMLAANEAIAMYGEANGVPMPFRCQGMEEVFEFELDSTPEGPCRSWLAIQSTTRSQILATPRPHDGLGLDLYVQATSPVRRYADLALHHQLKAHLRGDELPFPSSDGASALVRLAQDGSKISRPLERSANDYWLREFLRRRGGDPTEILVLSGDRSKDDVYKLFLPELGAIVTYKSTRPLEIGATIDMPSLALAEFV